MRLLTGIVAARLDADCRVLLIRLRLFVLIRLLALIELFDLIFGIDIITAVSAVLVHDLAIDFISVAVALCLLHTIQTSIIYIGVT